ncbi:hypothetical protein NR798_24140 [Archangium gephyra]|uniref:hypothetical protein n=1 Tax=Archangium gephyra TaxID=48 RepID=UPI0035D4A7FC
MMTPGEVLMVDANGKVRWTLPAPVAAFQILPAAGNRGGYPLKAIVNPEDTEPTDVTVLGPSDEAGAAGTAARVVEVVNASPGDVYQLFAGSGAEDRRRLMVRTGADGYAAVRRAPSVVLFSKVFGGTGIMGAQLLSGSVYIHPAPLSDGGVILDTAIAAPWDVGQYTGVRMVFEAIAPYAATRFQPFIELVPGPESHLYPTFAATPLPRVYLGTNNYGAGSILQHGHAVLGAHVDLNDPERTMSPEWSPWLRFGVEVAGGTFPDTTDPLWVMSMQLRLTVTAW